MVTELEEEWNRGGGERTFSRHDVESLESGTERLKGMYFQLRNHPEMALVAGHQSVAEVNRGSANEQIGERNPQTLLPGFGIHFCFGTLQK